MHNRRTNLTRRAVDARRGVTYVLYGAALFTSSVVTFGTAGILPGLVIPAAWCYVFFSRSRPAALLHVTVAIVLGACLFGLFSPAVQTREAARRTQCFANLKAIALALQNYHDVYRSFPPAYTTDRNGRPLHSWRVLILPFLDQTPLYERFNLSEPWDSPHNLDLARHFPEVFACPSRRNRYEVREYTSYVAVVGEGTAWPGARGRSITEFPDGIANTILLVEYDSGILWTEPRDLEFDEALRVLAGPDPEWTRGHCAVDFFYEEYYGVETALADGTVRFMPLGGDLQIWSSLLVVDDGAPPDASEVALPHPAGESRLRVDNCIRLGAFVFLMLFPLPWVWLNPNSAAEQSQQSREP